MSALQTNRTPWTDAITLVTPPAEQDAQGYWNGTTEPPDGDPAPDPEEDTEIMCCFSEGVARGEFYESYKAGLRASCAAEVWEDDYGNEPRVRHGTTDYEVVRHYPTGRGTVMLILQEVIR